MNFFIALKTNMIYVCRMFRILWKTDKPFLFLIIADIILNVTFPFVNMYLIKYSIDMLTHAAEFSAYLPFVMALLALTCILQILQNIIGTSANIHGNVIGSRLFDDIFKKSMELDYEMLLNKRIQEKRELAMQVIAQGRFNNLTQNFRFLVCNLFILAGVIFILSTIELWILGIVVAIVIINSAEDRYRPGDLPGRAAGDP